MQNIKTIYDVFKTQGQPTVTYVKRCNGDLEKKLSAALDNKGTLCLLTGASKTGKTTLFTQVLNERNQEILTIRCDKDLTSNEVWKRALEQVDFTRIKSFQTGKTQGSSKGAKIGGQIGWNILAGLTGEGQVSHSSTMSETEIREKILAEPMADHLVPVLKNSPYILVVEDFHYLNEETQKSIFQQWKVFIDSEISVIVVGTTHHATDLAYANKDLIGRISHIDLSTWEIKDLEKICSQGFEYLKLPIPQDMIETIAKESVGLPIITQATCLQILLDAGIKDITSQAYPPIYFLKQKQHVYDALHKVARNKYGPFEAIYDRLIRGPKRGAKYETYKLVLSAFAVDPDSVKFSLTKEEIYEKLKNLLKENPNAIPPATSINTTLQALGSFQNKLGLSLFEWLETDKRLYALEPAFLFYLRWREARTSAILPEELLQTLNLAIKGISYAMKLFSNKGMKPPLESAGEKSE